MAERKVSGDIKEIANSQIKRNKLTVPLYIWFIVIAFAIVIGYVAGVYHYQIEAAIGPVFGYKIHSGEINLSSLQETYSKLAANYDGKLDTTKLIQGANSGLVSAAGDEYTVYMTPNEASDYQNMLSGEIGSGIGAEIGKKNNQVVIISVLDGNPAKASGLLANDIILAINDQSTSGWSVDKAVSKIRGEKGTTVKLKIQRNSSVKTFTITRAEIYYPSVTSSVNDNIGIITINRFDDETVNLAKKAALDFKNEKKDGVILDLRNDGGGYVDAAVGVAGIWLNDKIVVTERSSGLIKDTLKTDREAILEGFPTVVLVNGGSASASEIVAGALRDYKVAKLVGEKTYGKGSIQSLLGLSGGSMLKVTIARWYTPNGKNINNEGIKPDITVKLDQSDIDKGADPQIDAAKKLLSS